MRKILFCFGLLLFTKQILFGQDHTDFALFYRAKSLQELVLDFQKEIKSSKDSIDYTSFLEAQSKKVAQQALPYYVRIIDEYPASQFRYEALKNLAQLSEIMRDNKSQVYYLEKILEDTLKFVDANGIFFTDYKVYKNRACMYLVEYYIHQQAYNQALQYIEDAENKYPYQHFCGNALYNNQVFLDEKRAICYAGLGDIQKALEIVLPYLFDTMIDYEESIEKLIVELLKKQDWEENKIAFEEAIKNIQGKEGEYELHYKGVKIVVLAEFLFDENNKKTIQENIRETSFYQLLNQK